MAEYKNLSTEKKLDYRDIMEGWQETRNDALNGVRAMTMLGIMDTERSVAYTKMIWRAYNDFKDKLVAQLAAGILNPRV